MADMEERDHYEFQPIEGVPVMQCGNRFYPLDIPIDMGCNDAKTVFWFIYQGAVCKKKGKLTVDTEKNTETLEEITGGE